MKLKSLLCVFVFVYLSQHGNAQPGQKRALFVIVDGIPADVIEKLKTPALDLVKKEGGYTRAHVGGDSGTVTETPTISAVGYNSLLTGVWVNKHNVWDNDIAAPNYNYWNIFRLFKSQYPNKKTAVFSTWLENRTKLIGSLAPAAGNLQPDYYFDGLELDTVNYPHDKDANYIHRIDEIVTDSAAAVIKRVSPDLTWVYLEFTDDMGHQHGDSKQFYDAIQTMDKQIGRLWNAIEYRRKNFGEDWVVYVTTDHGRDAVTGKNHGGQSKRERSTWIVTNAKGLNEYFFKGNPGIVDIMPSLANFLEVQIPREKLMEIDGIPLTGKLSATHLKVEMENKRINIEWSPVSKEGEAKIWLSLTNNFKTGGKDKYVQLIKVPIASSFVSVDVTQLPSDIYKIVVEMPDNLLTAWVVPK